MKMVRGKSPWYKFVARMLVSEKSVNKVVQAKLIVGKCLNGDITLCSTGWTKLLLTIPRYCKQ